MWTMLIMIFLLTLGVEVSALALKRAAAPPPTKRERELLVTLRDLRRKEHSLHLPATFLDYVKTGRAANAVEKKAAALAIERRKLSTGRLAQAAQTALKVRGAATLALIAAFCGSPDCGVMVLPAGLAWPLESVSVYIWTLAVHWVVASGVAGAVRVLS